MILKYRPEMFGNHILTPSRLETIRNNINESVLTVLDGTQRPSGGRFGFGWNDALTMSGADYSPFGLEKYTVDLTTLELKGYQHGRLFVRSNYGGSSQLAAERSLINSHIVSDFYAVQAFALKYFISGDEQAAGKAVEILETWAAIEFWNMPVSDTRLLMSSKWPGYILSAMLISGSDAYTEPVSNRLKAATAKWWPQLSTAYASGQSNWAAWGCVFEMSCAVFLGDKDRFNKATLLWRRVFDRSVSADIPWTEIGRSGGEDLGAEGGISGIQYSNFFVNAMVRAAEIARVNGVWLYDHVSPDGSTLRKLYENCVGWVRDWETGPYSGPETPTRNIQSYIHILHNLWPTDDSTNIVEGQPSPSGDAVGPGDVFQDFTGHSFTPLIYCENPFND